MLAAVLGLAATAALAVAGWALQTVHTLEIRISVLTEELNTIKADTSDSEEFKQSIRKHWKLHSWARDEINNLKYKNGLPITGWPLSD